MDPVELPGKEENPSVECSCDYVGISPAGLGANISPCVRRTGVSQQFLGGFHCAGFSVVQFVDRLWEM
jgi:hypothetical protein